MISSLRIQKPPLFPSPTAADPGAPRDATSAWVFLASSPDCPSLSLSLSLSFFCGFSLEIGETSISALKRVELFRAEKSVYETTVFSRNRVLKSPSAGKFPSTRSWLPGTRGRFPAEKEKTGRVSRGDERRQGSFARGLAGSEDGQAYQNISQRVDQERQEVREAARKLTSTKKRSTT